MLPYAKSRLRTTDLKCVECERLMASSVITSPSPVSVLWSTVTCLAQDLGPAHLPGKKLLRKLWFSSVILLPVISVPMSMCKTCWHGWINPHQGVKFRMLDSVMSFMKELPTSNDASPLRFWSALRHIVLDKSRFLKENEPAGECLYINIYIIYIDKYLYILCDREEKSVSGVGTFSKGTNDIHKLSNTVSNSVPTW